MSVKDDSLSREDCPFDVEKILECIQRAEQICPGVYRFSVRCDGELLGNEYYAVEKSAPAISLEAKSYGYALPNQPELLLYPTSETNGNWMILEYEISKYRVKNQLPLLAGETLHSFAIFAMERHPEYFGMLPPPMITSRGYTVRYKVMGNGIYWIETDRCEEVLAVAFPIWDSELSETAEKLSEQTEYDKVRKIDHTLGYLFFSEHSCSIPIYELLQTRPEWITSGMVNKAALMNAIWNDHPTYALAYNNLEQAGVSDPLGAILNELGVDIELTPPEDHMITFSPDIGATFLNL